jgi:cobalt-zinc-cadmium resistance protein CzcA
VKIVGPDLDQLELLATKVKNEMQTIRGMENVGIFHIRGQSHMEFRVDPEKCQRWGVMTADVNNVISSALGANPQNNMVEGEKLFPIAIRWPERLRNNESSILDIPVDITNNQVVLNQYPGTGGGAVAVPTAKGFANPDPAVAGTLVNTANPLSNSPRLRLRDLVSPVGEDGATYPGGQFERAGAQDIYREQGSSSASAAATWAAPSTRPKPAPRISSKPRTERSGAASSSRWRTPRGVCCGSSRSRWA